MNVDFQKLINLIDNPTHCPMKAVAAHSAWIYGDENQALKMHDKPEDMLMHQLDLEQGGNEGLVAKYKQSSRVVSQIIAATIKSALSTTSYDALLVHKEKFIYKDAETGDQYYDGYVMLKMILNVIKPDLVVDVKTLEGYLQNMSLAKADNDFRRMCDVMLGWQQEINVEKGEDS